MSNLTPAQSFALDTYAIAFAEDVMHQAVALNRDAIARDLDRSVAVLRAEAKAALESAFDLIRAGESVETALADAAHYAARWAVETLEA